MEVFILALFVGAICGAIASAIVKEEKRPMAFILGLLLGPFGILIAVLMKD